MLKVSFFRRDINAATITLMTFASLYYFLIPDARILVIVVVKFAHFTRLPYPA